MNLNISKLLSLAGMLFAWISCNGSEANNQVRPMPLPTLPERVETVEIRVNLIEAGNIKLFRKKISEITFAKN